MALHRRGRRVFLGLLARLSLLGLLGSAWAREPPAALTQPARLGRRLVGLLAHSESARVVGWQYLRQAPAEADRDRLLEALRRACPDLHAGLGTAELGKRLRTLQRSDFELGRTVQIGGWMLSQTEARLCALAALSQAPTRVYRTVR